MKTYNHTRESIIDMGYNPEPIELIANKISLSDNIEKAEKLFLSFEEEANKLPWPQDHDFGALVLQHKAKCATNIEIRGFMINKAIKRAKWCASCATSGSEGIARAKHINELEFEYRNDF